MAITLCAIMVAGLMPYQAQATTVELEVYSPKASLDVPTLYRLAERLDVGTIEITDPLLGTVTVPDLNGKRILVWAYSKDASGGVNYQTVIQQLLREWYPDVIITGTHTKSGVTWEQGVWSYDAIVRGLSSATATNTPGVDAVIMGVAN